MGGISVDYGVMERAKEVLVIPADIGWNDMGSWEAMRELFERMPPETLCAANT